MNLIDRINEFRKSDVVRRFITYYSFTIINSVIGFVSITILSRYLDPEEYGMIGLFNSFLYFMPSLLCFSCIGLQGINIINLSINDYYSFRNYLLSFILVIFSIFLLVGLFVLFIFPSAFPILLLVLFDSLFILLITIHSTELVQLKKSFIWGILGSGAILVTFLITLLFVVYFHMGWHGRLLGIIIGDAAFCLIRYFKFSNIFDKFKFTLDKKHVTIFINYGFPILISLAPAWVLANSDRYVLLYFFSMKEVGLYTASFGIASIIGTLNTVVVKVFVPDIYQCLKDRTGLNKIRKISFSYSLIVMFAASFLSLLAFSLLKYILGEKYASTAPIITIMSFAQAFFGVYCIMGLVLDYYKLNKLKTTIVIGSAIVCILVSLGSIKWLGVYAPAFGTMGGYAFLAFASIIKTNKYLKINNVS